jgi:hypothetical protein
MDPTQSSHAPQVHAHEPTYYRHSGRISFFGVVGGLATSAMLVIGVAPLYALVLVYNPSAYLGIVLPFLFGAAIGGLVAWAMKKLGSRSWWFAPVLAFFTAAIAYAVSWPAWFAVMLWRNDLGLEALAAFWPPAFLELLAGAYEEGVWTLGRSDSAVSGPFLGIIWLLEAAIVLVTTPAVALGVAGSGVYCEGCHRWCVRVPGDASLEARFHASSAGQLSNALERRDLSVLTMVPRADDAENEWVGGSLQVCDGCGGTNTLLLESVTRTYDSKGRPQLSRHRLVQHLLLRKDETDWARSTVFGA